MWYWVCFDDRQCDTSKFVWKKELCSVLLLALHDQWTLYYSYCIWAIASQWLQGNMQEGNSCNWHSEESVGSCDGLSWERNTMQVVTGGEMRKMSSDWVKVTQDLPALRSGGHGGSSRRDKVDTAHWWVCKLETEICVVVHIVLGDSIGCLCVCSSMEAVLYCDSTDLCRAEISKAFSIGPW